MQRSHTLDSSPRRTTRRTSWLAATIVCLALAARVSLAVASVPPWIVDPENPNPTPDLAPKLLLIGDPSTAENRHEFDAIRYQLTLYPDFTQDALTGYASITVKSLVPALSYVDLDLYSSLTVYSVTQAGAHLGFVHENDRLRIVLPTPLAEGVGISFSVQWGGKVAPAGFMGFDFKTTPSGSPTLSTLSQPYFARSWWPCKDTPEDKAQVFLTVFVPDGMFAASNGDLVAQIPSSAGTTFTWVESYPIATYNVSLAIADYVSWNESYVSPGGYSMDLEYHIFPEHEEAARYDFGRTSEILDYYVSLFGEYPFLDEDYGMAEFVWDGAMEHQTMTSYGDFFLTGDRFYERIIGHELAHHWWGNSMTLADWNDLWIHEGFATYSEGLWKEYLEGPSGMRNFLRPRSNAFVGFAGPIVPPSQLFNQTVYNKSAWVLHMLRGLLGDDTFFASAREIAGRTDLQYGSIATADVVESFEKLAGRPLQWFFDQWLYREGRPTIRFDWDVDDGFGYGHLVSVDLEQMQDADPFTFPVTVRVRTEDGDEDFEVWVGSRQTESRFFVDSTPLDVQLDPDGWLLHFDYEEHSPTSAPRALDTARLLPNVPNPFNPTTELRFELAAPSDVALRILDARGRVVDVLRPGTLSAGEHALPWRGLDAEGRSVASGVYRVLLESDTGSTPARSITLVR